MAFGLVLRDVPKGPSTNFRWFIVDIRVPGRKYYAVTWALCLFLRGYGLKLVWDAVLGGFRAWGLVVRDGSAIDM